MTSKLANIDKRSFRGNWHFVAESYSGPSAESLQDLRDNLCLKKHLKRAVANDLAPMSLIQTIREAIRK